MSNDVLGNPGQEHLATVSEHESLPQDSPQGRLSIWVVPASEHVGPLAESLRKVLSVFVEATVEVQEVSAARSALEARSTAESPSPLVLVQEVAPTDARQHSPRKHWVEGAKGDTPVGPLAFRQSLEQRSSSGGSAGDQFKTYSSYAVPILYFSTFELPKLGLGYRDGDGAVPTPLSAQRSDLLFLDSSIWHRYVNLASEHSLVTLLKTLAEIRRWLRHGRYATTAALEHLDFSVRSFREMYIPSLRTGSQHGSYVAVHGAHSEAQAARCAISIGQDLVKRSTCKKRLGYRFLMIDDYAIKPLRRADGREGTQSKGQAVWEALAEYIPCQDACECCRGSAPTRECSICRCVTSLSEARGALALDESDAEQNGERYDVLLLDYLLGARSDGPAPGDEREYGHELLRHLEGADSARGPLGECWVFPISAFAGAFQAEFAKGAVPNVGTSMNVAQGADPLCTPHLFAFKLLRFLRTLATQAIERPVEELTSVLVSLANRSAAHDDSFRQLAQRAYFASIATQAVWRRLDDDEAKSLFSRQAKLVYPARIEELLDLTEMLRLLWVVPKTEWRRVAGHVVRLRLAAKRAAEDCDFVRHGFGNALLEALEAIEKELDRWSNPDGGPP